MKYGILGGTFDPPHLGHLYIAREALQQLGLYEVVWVPAFRNPLKRTRRTDARQRLKMCGLTIENEPGMAVSDIETSRGGDSFLVDTLEELHLAMPGEYWFIVGMDALATFGEWKKPERVLQLCRLAAFARPGTDVETTLARLGPAVGESLDLLEAAPKAVSSSIIRDMARRGEDYSHLVAPSVYEYIKEHGLYED